MGHERDETPGPSTRPTKTGSESERRVLLAGGDLDGQIAQGVRMVEPDEMLYHEGHFYRYTGRVAAYMEDRPFIYILTA